MRSTAKTLAKNLNLEAHGPPVFGQHHPLLVSFGPKKQAEKTIDSFAVSNVSFVFLLQTTIAALILLCALFFCANLVNAAPVGQVSPEKHVEKYIDSNIFSRIGPTLHTKIGRIHRATSCTMIHSCKSMNRISLLTTNIHSFLTN